MAIHLERNRDTTATYSRCRETTDTRTPSFAVQDMPSQFPNPAAHSATKVTRLNSGIAGADTDRRSTGLINTWEPTRDSSRSSNSMDKIVATKELSRDSLGSSSTVHRTMDTNTDRRTIVSTNRDRVIVAHRQTDRDIGSNFPFTPNETNNLFLLGVPARYSLVRPTNTMDQRGRSWDQPTSNSRSR